MSECVSVFIQLLVIRSWFSNVEPEEGGGAFNLRHIQLFEVVDVGNRGGAKFVGFERFLSERMRRNCACYQLR